MRLRPALCLPLALSSALGQSDARPFAPPSGDGRAMRFTAIPSAHSGVTLPNAYDDPQQWWDRYLEFTVGAIGSGIAVADVDGDGRPDLFLAGKTGRCALYRNLGDWRFTDITVAAGLAATTAPADAWNNGAAFADVNNDGRPDLLLCRFNAPNQLWLNQGDGSFRETAAAAGLDLVDASGMAACADFDRDGWLDVLIQTNLFRAGAAPAGQRDRLYRNRGDGTFADVTDRAGLGGATQGHAAIWWDHDDDGWPDLYLANDFSAPDQLWHNRRDGTFVDRLSAALPHTPFSAMGADLGDINNDGRLDLFVADMAATSWARDHRGMAESRDKADPAVDAHPTPQVLRNALYLNTGTGRFAEAAALAGLAATDWTWSPRFEDFDNDGRLDLHVTTGMVRELHNADLLARTMVAESPAERIRLMRDSPPLAEPNLAYRNLGDMTFAPVGPAWGLDQTGVSFASACGDFDGDGDLDLVVANYQAEFSLLRNDSPAGHRITFALRGTTSNRQGVGATVTLATAAGPQVRTLVLARGYLGSSEPVVHFGLGPSPVVDRVTIRWPSGTVQVLENLPANHAYTVTEPSAAPPSPPPSPPAPRYREQAAAAGIAFRPLAPPFDETVRQPLLPFRHHLVAPRLAIADFNRDGCPDAVLGGTDAQPARVLFGGDGRFHPVTLPDPREPAFGLDGAVLTFDADRDGDSDILLTGSGAAAPDGHPSYQPRLWLNQGRGFDPAPALPAWPHSSTTAVAADFDRDGWPDVFLAARLRPGAWPQPAPATLWFGSPRGFAARPAIDAIFTGQPGLVTAAVTADADGDGWTDLITASEWGPVVVWLNQAGQGFRPRPLGGDSAHGWWRALATADVNGDGRPDFVAGNVGLNTVYRPPAILYHGNFGGRRGPSLLEAVIEAGQERPRASRPVLAAALPPVARRFRRSDDYAAATLADLVGAPALAGALRRQADEFRSGVWLSRDAGDWAFVPLDPVAQLGPVGAIGVADADGDGHPDLFLGQNDFSPVPRIGRFDGGLSGLWHGDGTGTFRFEDWARSGLVVTGAVSAVAPIDSDRDGRIEWLVSRGAEALQHWVPVSPVPTP